MILSWKTKQKNTDTATEITNHFSVNSWVWGDACWKEKKTHRYSYRNHQSFYCKQWGWGWCLLEKKKTHQYSYRNHQSFICKQWGWGVGVGGVWQGSHTEGMGVVLVEETIGKILWCKCKGIITQDLPILRSGNWAFESEDPEEHWPVTDKLHN